MITSENSKAFQANLFCKQEISKAIKEGFDGYHFNDALVHPVIRKCGYVRTGTILANTVVRKKGDVRISKDNMKWAEEWEYTIADEQQQLELLLEKHNSILVDAFVLKFRSLADKYYYPLPDTSVDSDDIYYYGYLSPDHVYPLGQVKALELFEKDLPILLLYSDDTEKYAYEKEEIKEHCENGGFCGIEKDVWINDVLFATMLKQSENNNAEVMLLYGAKDHIGIYQLRKNSEKEYHFQNYNKLLEKGLKAERKNYELVYDMKCEYFTEVSDSDILEEQFELFNLERPDDFTGHSLSVSDVLVLRRSGLTKAYYVDSIGFVELPTFFEEAEAYIVHFKVDKSLNIVKDFSKKEEAIAFAEKKKEEYNSHDVLYISWKRNGEEEIIKTY